MKILKFNNKGQGIIEVVVAIAVIVVGLVSIISLVVFNLNVQNYNHDMLIASNLAREGIEVIRSVRDNNWLSSDIDCSACEHCDQETCWDYNLTYMNLYYPNFEDENSFFIYSKYVWSDPGEDSGYWIFPLGLSWDVCTDEAEDDSRFCRLYIMPISTYPDIKLYDLSGDGIEGAIPTKFYRLIYINEICFDGNDESILIGYNEHCDASGLEKIGLQILSRVGWNFRGAMRTVDIEERLYNWK